MHYVLTLVFIAILIFTSLEEFNINLEMIKGGVMMLEQFFPYVIIAGALYFLAKGFTGGQSNVNNKGGQSSNRNSSRRDRGTGGDQ